MSMDVFSLTLTDLISFGVDYLSEVKNREILNIILGHGLPLPEFPQHSNYLELSPYATFPDSYTLLVCLSPHNRINVVNVACQACGVFTFMASAGEIKGQTLDRAFLNNLNTLHQCHD